MALDEKDEPGVNGRRYVIVGAGAIGGTVGGEGEAVDADRHPVKVAAAAQELGEVDRPVDP